MTSTTKRRRRQQQQRRHDDTTTTELLVRTINDTAEIMLTATSATAETTTTTTKRSSALGVIYSNLASTFELVVRLIREHRRSLLNDSAFCHHRRRRRDDDDRKSRRLSRRREHRYIYDHRGCCRDDDDDDAAAANCNDGCVATTAAIVRSTVVSSDYVRDLVELTIRSIAQRRKIEMWRTEQRDVMSMFAYALRKIVARAIRTMAQRVIERRRQQLLEVTPQPPPIAAAPTPTLSSSSMLSCHVCNRSFDKTFHYLQHIRVHYRLNLYLCVYCGDSFVQQNGLNYHVRQCCPLVPMSSGGDGGGGGGGGGGAGKKTKPPQSLTTTAASGQHYELCDSCGRFFENGRSLRNHVLRQHADRNVDLGVNRTQQEYLRRIMSSHYDDV